MEPAIIVKSKKGKKNRGKQNQESKQNKFVNEWEKDLINPSPATHIKIEPVQNKTKNKQQKKGKKNNQLYEDSIKEAIRENEIANKDVEEKAKAKASQLQQIIEMFGSTIDKDIINDYWNNLNCDYEQTITFLSEFVNEIENNKKIEESKSQKA